MKNIVLFDTACGSQNIGDYIICESVEKELEYILADNFYVHYATHTPLTGFISRIFADPVIGYCNTASYKFLCGTNLLSTMMLRPHPNWRVNMFDYKPYRNSICVGVGSDVIHGHMHGYEKQLYKRILSKQYVHSVRDERTAKMLKGLGFKAVNTGCPTTWSLNLQTIENSYGTEKPDAVLFTLTDYAKDKERDIAILDILLHRYETVLFWPQGAQDFEYMKQLGKLNDVKLISPNLKSYQTLMSEPFDYVGTRLHGGIYALAHGHRTVIMAVDHRAKDMALTSGIPVISREDFDALYTALEFHEPPSLHIPYDAIAEWKSQFSA